MTQATITLPEEIDEALAAYGRDRGLAADRGAVAEAAIHDLLAGLGYLSRPARFTPIEREDERALRALIADRRAEIPFRPFHITPLHRDDGPTDISENHDRYFADGETSGPC